MIQFYRTPGILRLLANDLIWKIPVSNKEIFLTFDDGPIPGLTEYVLQELRTYKAKATFFCVGDNIYKHPEIFEKVIDQGHAIGNHTFNHLKAWTAEKNQYLLNVDKCQQIIQRKYQIEPKPFFRPPHGQITRKLISDLKDQYKIIMWDVLSYDFSTTQSPEQSLKKSIHKTRPGSIVVFHDNYKAESKLKFMLPGYLKHFSNLGYSFKKLSSV